MWSSWLLLSLKLTLIATQQTTPNILVILADDLGFNNVGYNNKQSKEVNTPNIDYLVENGLQLNRHYVHFCCSPTRSSFQSGRLPVHCNQSNKPARVNVYNGIPPNYTVIAERLKYDANYSTHFVGKWDAGSTVMQQTPYGRGYDTAFGYLNHLNDYWNENNFNCSETLIVDLWDNNKPATNYNNTIYEEYLFAQRVYNNIDNAAQLNKPFFMVYAAHIAHSPIQIPKDELYTFDNDEYMCKNYNFNFVIGNPIYPGMNTTNINDWNCRSIYQSMVNLLDVIIGNITRKLKENNIYNNTLIIFSADNGGMESLNETGANNHPLRGSKMTPWEGGIRAAAFVSGGYLPIERRGEIENNMIHITDWYSTFCYLAHINPMDKRAATAGLLPIDSMNIWPLISGENVTSPRTEIPIDNHTLIQNNYKLIINTSVNFASWGGEIWPNASSIDHPIKGTILNCQKGCLFDLEYDLTEHNNIINENMDIAQQMNERLVELKKGYYTNNEVGTPLCPSNITMSCQCWAAVNLYNGFWGPSHEI